MSAEIQIEEAQLPDAGIWKQVKSTVTLTTRGKYVMYLSVPRLNLLCQEWEAMMWKRKTGHSQVRRCEESLFLRVFLSISPTALALAAGWRQSPLYTICRLLRRLAIFLRRDGPS